jgi:Nucleotide-diphospho-sugar transferase
MRQSTREIKQQTLQPLPPPPRRNGGGGRSSSHHYYSSIHLIICSLVSGSIGLYVGLLLGTGLPDHHHTDAGMMMSVLEKQKRTAAEQLRRATWEQQQQQEATASRLFPSSIGSYASGMAVVDRDSLAVTLDMGVPLDPSMRNNNQVLLIYQSDDSLPNADIAKQQAISLNESIPSLLVDDALANCHAVHVILTQPSKRHQCLAVMHQYESFHLQKFMRLPEQHGPVEATLPLRLVNRGSQANGRQSAKPPTITDTQAYWSVLNTYLTNFEANLAAVSQLAARVAVQNTVIVLVCNAGQSDLLVNFICANRHRGLSTDHLLVFATDIETRDLMNSLNIAVVYDATQTLPKQAAGRYADATFAKMMLAKVWCVQQLIWLGYNVLFQDVDVVWFKDPLPYFLATATTTTSGGGGGSNKEYDMYFQDEYVFRVVD